MTWLILSKEIKISDEYSNFVSVVRCLKGLCYLWWTWTPVMINFMHQLDWATGSPNIWPSTILNVSIRMVLDEMNISVGRLSKLDYFS